MYYVVNFLAIPVHFLIILLVVWLIIKLLPATLELVGLKKSVNDTTLVWLNTTLIGFALIFALIQPIIAFLAHYYPL